MGLILPQAVQKAVSLDAGYDRFAGLPTLTGDLFLPVKAWSDRAVFVNPHMSLTGTTESFSVGAGFRHLLTSETMVGFHAFEDWARPRGSRDRFLKQAGVGLEFSALPGKFSDVTFSVNAYLPVNERRRIQAGETLVKEAATAGLDARLSLLLPPLIDALDLRVDAKVHSFRGKKTDVHGYQAGLTVTSRDGMFYGTVERGNDGRLGDNYRVWAGITLAFDWTALTRAEMPFSAPYTVSGTRYQRKVRDSLYEKTARKRDLPTDRSERRIALGTRAYDDSVVFSGGFPETPNAALSVQVSQSPWRECMEVVTDSEGFYSGRLPLAPGTYRLRLVHKPTGRASQVTTVVIPGQ